MFKFYANLDPMTKSLVKVSAIQLTLTSALVIVTKVAQSKI